MAGFTKLVSSITTSSVWLEPDSTLRIWIAMLAMADAEGFVEGSVPGFAHLCLMSVEDFQKAIQPLLDPDEHSRTKDNDGRRLGVHNGGWKILNYELYRKREQNKPGSRASYYRQWRAKKVEESKANYGEKAQGSTVA